MPQEPGDRLPDTSTPFADATPHSKGATSLPMPPTEDDITISIMTALAATELTAIFIAAGPGLVSLGLLLIIVWQGRPKSRYRINVREATREARVASIFIWLGLVKALLGGTFSEAWQHPFNHPFDLNVEGLRDAAGWLFTAGLIVGLVDARTAAKREARAVAYQRELKDRGIIS